MLSDSDLEFAQVILRALQDSPELAEAAVTRAILRTGGRPTEASINDVMIDGFVSVATFLAEHSDRFPGNPKDRTDVEVEFDRIVQGMEAPDA